MGLYECGGLKNYESKKKETKQFIQNHPGFELFLKHSPQIYIYATYMTSVYTMMSPKPCC